MICLNCNNQIDDDVKFCNVCGAPVGVAVKTSNKRKIPYAVNITMTVLLMIPLILILVCTSLRTLMSDKVIHDIIDSTAVSMTKTQISDVVNELPTSGNVNWNEVIKNIGDYSNEPGSIGAYIEESEFNVMLVDYVLGLKNYLFFDGEYKAINVEEFKNKLSNTKNIQMKYFSQTTEEDGVKFAEFIVKSVDEQMHKECIKLFSYGNTIFLLIKGVTSDMFLYCQIVLAVFIVAFWAAYIFLTNKDYCIAISCIGASIAISGGIIKIIIMKAFDILKTNKYVENIFDGAPGIMNEALGYRFMIMIIVGAVFVVAGIVAKIVLENLKKKI